MGVAAGRDLRGAGLAIKKGSPFPHTPASPSWPNGSIGYIPNKAAYPQGNYEVVSSRCAVGSGELLVEGREPAPGRGRGSDVSPLPLRGGAEGKRSGCPQATVSGSPSGYA